MSHHSVRVRWALVFAVLFGVTGGCNTGDQGPKRYSISGTVTYDGHPVPTGFVTFLPDVGRGNKGPGSGAAIVKGHFQTEPGKGVIGGPHIVKIVGYDGVATSVEGEQLADGQSLFVPFTSKVDFPQQEGTFDFQVPKAEQ